MKNTRKILAIVAVAAGLAVGTAIVYAHSSGGYGPGAAGCTWGEAGASGGGYGPGMMGYGDGPHGGYGPGMMGYGGGPRGGHGPDMMGNGGGYGPGMMGYGAGPHGGYGTGTAAGAGFVEHMDARLSFLKDEFKITPDQQAAWDAYATQAKAQAATMQTFHAQPPSTAQTATERIEQRAERAKLRAEQMKAMSAVVKDLYAALTPEQKTVADRYFGGPRLSQGGPRGYGR